MAELRVDFTNPANPKCFIDDKPVSLTAAIQLMDEISDISAKIARRQIELEEELSDMVVELTSNDFESL